MKTPFWIALSTLVLASLACTISLPVQNISASDLQTVTINEPAPQGEGPVEIIIGMGGGVLELQGGAQSLIEGSIRYNVPAWNPVIRRGENSLSIRQSSDFGSASKLPVGDLINKWELKLGQIPMDLTLEVGAYHGTLDLSGVPLANLKITDGASSAKINFDSPNPQKMSKLMYKTGASNIEISGLGNANFSEMSFEGGAGSYVLDFSGKLQEDATALINSGLGSMTIIIPKGTRSKIISMGELTNISMSGTWTTEGGIYSTAGEGPLLTITIDMSVGSLSLIQR